MTNFILDLRFFILHAGQARLVKIKLVSLSLGIQKNKYIVGENTEGKVIFPNCRGKVKLVALGF